MEMSFSGAPALTGFLDRGGPAMWIIAALSVLTVALILWKTWRLVRLGAWSRRPAERAIDLFASGDAAGARTALGDASRLHARLVRGAIDALDNLTEAAAREETVRVARATLAEARTGLRALELIAVIAPLLGLLGTVLGMIEAFQVLQESGARADAAALAGGIWEALMTTAAGMAVAIPASMALSWFESICDRVQHEMEDMATRLFTRRPATRRRAEAA